MTICGISGCHSVSGWSSRSTHQPADHFLIEIHAFDETGQGKTLVGLVHLESVGVHDEERREAVGWHPRRPEEAGVGGRPGKEPGSVRSFRMALGQSLLDLGVDRMIERAAVAG